MRTFLFACHRRAAPSPRPPAPRPATSAITSFDQVRVEGPYKVKLTTGVPPFARASGTQLGARPRVDRSPGSTLVVHPNRRRGAAIPARIRARSRSRSARMS